MRPPRAPFLLAATLAAAWGCSPDERNFAEYPGFAEHYAASPPKTEIPAEAERALLERHRPRIFLPEGNEGPIDFYRDYVAHGTLYGEDGEALSDDVTPELLNRVNGTRAVFAHRPPGTPPSPVVYGRVDREPFELGGRSREFTFLTYTLVFRHSGLPAGVTGIRALALALVGDLDDWHQLDHYTAVTIALDEGLRPRAATFQHHNHMRSHILGPETGPGRLALPADGRIAVDVAIRSNELYPHAPGGAEHRAVPFPTRKLARYLFMGEGSPLMGSLDITSPDREIDPPLAFLPPADAFYTFQGWLGERRTVPGRDGPPGADYNTLPAFKPRPLQMIAFHWWDDDREYTEWYESADRSGAQGLGPIRRRFAGMLGAP